jgi:UDP-N-acetylmuramate dehydrogenase
VDPDPAQVLLGALTTLRLGGAARRLIEATTDEHVVAAVRAADAGGERLLVLAGGSNVVVADEGFPGTVVRVVTRGIDRDGDVLHVAAGEPWDLFVADCVARDLAGVECLSGIPGSVGATPIQNVGAYGQEVADTIVGVRTYDREQRAVRDLAPQDCGFGYRTSAFKRDPGRHVVLRVSYALTPSALSMPLRYGELRRRVGADRAPLAEVRDAVLALRRGKGMVLDDGDHDTWSAGSFFTNPVLTATQLEDLRARAGEDPPAWPEPDGRIKTSAAWLIERAGFARGHGDPRRIAISSKHTLALTNRGAGTTQDLVALASEVAAGVEEAFGVQLVPEPVFVGRAWSGAGRSATPDVELR